MGSGGYLGLSFFYCCMRVADVERFFFFRGVGMVFFL